MLKAKKSNLTKKDISKNISLKSLSFIANKKLNKKVDNY
jgi:hypothetical protein